MLKLKGTYSQATLDLLEKACSGYPEDALTPIDPEVKTLWVAALRSNVYKQDSKSLALVGKYGHCCLGVLCETVPYITWKPDSTEGMYIQPSNAQIPQDIANTLKLTNKIQEILSSLNDTPAEYGGMDFDGIADFIEIEL